MPDLHSLPLSDLEAMCAPPLLDLYRRIHRDPESYRAAILDSLTRPRLPIEELLSTIREQAEPTAAWMNVVEICRHSAPSAPWNDLPQPDIGRDIVAAEHWLASQLRKLDSATGIYLGLDTFNMCDGHGKNVEIGGTADCDPLNDSIEWLNKRLTYADHHLIHGLYELHTEYSKADWRVPDKSIPCRSSFSFADYVLFLTYSGIVLGHAFRRLAIRRLLLASWGFHDGDMFLLGRSTEGGFSLLCSSGDS